VSDTIRIPVGDDSEVYWTLPPALDRIYNDIPEQHRGELQDVLSDVLGRFLLGITGLLVSGDIAGLQLLDDAVRIQIEAAYGRILRGRQP
jgi:hypothetical protein